MFRNLAIFAVVLSALILQDGCVSGKPVMQKGEDAAALAERTRTWATEELFKAAKGGHDEKARGFLRAGADVNAKDSEGATPIWHAARKGHVKAVLQLLGGNADVNIPGPGGATPLHITRMYDHNRIAEMLIKAGANQNALDDQGRTPEQCWYRGFGPKPDRFSR